MTSYTNLLKTFLRCGILKKIIIFRGALSDLKEVENNDKENLIKIAKNDKKFNLLIEKLYENNLISEKNYKLDSSSEIKGEDYKLDTVYF